MIKRKVKHGNLLFVIGAICFFIFMEYFFAIAGMLFFGEGDGSFMYSKLYYSIQMAVQLILYYYMYKSTNISGLVIGLTSMFLIINFILTLSGVF